MARRDQRFPIPVIHLPERTTSQSLCLGADGGTLLGAAVVRAPGSCGELVQGIGPNGYFLVSCPVDFYSRVRVEVRQGIAGLAENQVHVPEGSGKAGQAVSLTLESLGKTGLAVRVEISNPIPRGKGLGSSSADVVAAIAAAGLALGRELTPEQTACLAVQVEPTDGVMFPGIALFDHREGSVMERLGAPPPLEIVALDFGGEVDTLEFNRVDRRSLWESVAGETSEALELVRRGITQGDPALVGRGATISALAGQRVLPKNELSKVIELAEASGAAGVNVAHSGTIIGILLDARQKRGLSIFRKAKAAFPEAEAVHHFRVLSGGVRVVDAPA